MNEFLKKADEIKIKTYEQTMHPVSAVSTFTDANAFRGVGIKQTTQSTKVVEMKQGDSIIYDFGEHIVGYLSFDIKNLIEIADSPVRIRLVFAEIASELEGNASDYHGWLSASWIQEEIINVDVVPQRVALPRRYAFRYVKLEIVAVSSNFNVEISNVCAKTVTSADVIKLLPLPDEMDAELRKIDEVAARTLKNCMHSVFEDGPKRDRRLWIGDLRLQALTNYFTYKNNDLVKRCLYLLGGVERFGKLIPQCLFLTPKPKANQEALDDYSLLYIATLYDYYKYTSDKETVLDLWETAFSQAEAFAENLDERGVVRKKDGWWCFIDWCEELEKTTSLQGIGLYCLKMALFLANELGKKEEAEKLCAWINKMNDAALKYFICEENGYFSCEEDNWQVSWASNIWMILGGVSSKENSKKIISSLFEDKHAIKPVTPYLHHYLVEAMLKSDMEEEALSYIKEYWGSMIKKGADTFWEVYSPDDDYLSAYDDCMVNSSCHAWSCTPSYFIRKYYK